MIQGGGGFGVTGSIGGSCKVPLFVLPLLFSLYLHKSVQSLSQKGAGYVQLWLVNFLMSLKNRIKKVGWGRRGSCWMTAS